MHTLIVSLNPAVDCEWVVDSFRPIEKNEVHSERRWPGGKGINVARWLRWVGGSPQLFMPVGGESGNELIVGVRAEKIPLVVFPLRESTRVNVIITQRNGGPQYRLNPLWPRFTATEQREVLKALRQCVTQVETVILSGALPKSLPPTTYAHLVKQLRRLDKRVILDCDGAPFRLAAPEKPFLVKPNEAELSEWAGRPLKSLDDFRTVARELSQITDGWVLVSLGPQGALLVHHDQSFSEYQPVPKVIVRNTVGVGDAMLAAVVHGMTEGRSPSEWLYCGVQIGSEATQHPPGVLPLKRRIRRGGGR